MTLTDDGVERASLLHRGSLDLCVLAVLDQQPLHAYGVVQRLAEHGFADVSYGTVYPLVTRLRRLGLVEQRPSPGHGGPARTVLSLTREGQATRRRWSAQWRDHGRRVGALLDATGEREEQGRVG
jgi:PadR family transcriptional regulator, regulatory protein PadR